MGVAAGVAAIGAVGAIGGAVISSSAAQSAAGKQAAAGQAAAGNAQNQALLSTERLQPFVDTGQTATAFLHQIQNNPTELAYWGLPQQLGFQPTQAQLAATPGYQFDLTQGLQAVQNSNAASGQGISGSAMKGAAAYATGLANNTLSTQQGIFQSNLGNVLNLLQNNQNLGENAAAMTGQQGISATGQANQYATGAAASSAAGTVGSANALSAGLSGLASTPLNYLLYNQILNPAPATGGPNPGMQSPSDSSYTP